MTVTPPGAAQPTLVNVSFSLEPGQVLGVVGPSGAGKSTLARLVAGVWPARLGTARLDGADLRQWERGRLGDGWGMCRRTWNCSPGRWPRTSRAFPPRTAMAKYWPNA
ncbi:ATP-binding cassette domain-containing protein [Achromobacter xylosoxidans]